MCSHTADCHCCFQQVMFTASSFLQPEAISPYHFLLCSYGCCTFSKKHYTGNRAVAKIPQATPPSPTDLRIQQLVLWSRIDYCESTDVIIGIIMFDVIRGCQQIGRFKIRSVNTSHYQIIWAEHWNRLRW